MILEDLLTQLEKAKSVSTPDSLKLETCKEMLKLIEIFITYLESKAPNNAGQ